MRRSERWRFVRLNGIERKEREKKIYLIFGVNYLPLFGFEFERGVTTYEDPL